MTDRLGQIWNERAGLYRPAMVCRRIFPLHNGSTRREGFGNLDAMRFRGNHYMRAGSNAVFNLFRLLAPDEVLSCNTRPATKRTSCPQKESSTILANQSRSYTSALATLANPSHLLVHACTVPTTMIRSCSDDITTFATTCRRR